MPPTTSPLTDSLDQSKIHMVDVDGVQTRYYVDGEGEALVLLHGGHFGFIDSLDCWSLNFPGLAQHFRVYAVDKLGQGYTDNPGRDEDYTFEALFQHTARWLEVIGVRRAHLLGHSRGALLAASLALTVPDLALTVLIVDSNTLAPDDPRWPNMAFYDDIARRTPPGPPTRETVRMEPDENSYATTHVTDDFVDRYLEIARLPKTQHAQERMKVLSERVWTPSLMAKKRETLAQIDAHGFPVPTLIVWGFNDPSAPVPLASTLFERVAANTPAAELHVFNQAGHYSFREHPAAFNRLLQSFCLAEEPVRA